MEKAFRNKKPLPATRQAKNLRKLLVKAKFQIEPTVRQPRRVGFYPCGRCTYCKTGYVMFATEFTLFHREKPITWYYDRLFSCESLNVLYVAFCIHCPNIYVGKTKTTKQRISKHASDVRLPANSNCRKCAEHFGKCSKMREPFFRLLPFYYVDSPGLRHFMEKRFITKWKPTLNGNTV